MGRKSSANQAGRTPKRGARKGLEGEQGEMGVQLNEEKKMAQENLQRAAVNQPIAGTSKPRRRTRREKKKGADSRQGGVNGTGTP